MTLQKTYPQNKTILLDGIFLVWFICLLAIGQFAYRAPYFYDVINSIDASAEFQSIIPFSRYLFEPFIGSVFIFASPNASSLPFFVFLYFVIRAAFLLLPKKLSHQKRNDSKSKYLFLKTCLLGLSALILIATVLYYWLGADFILRYKTDLFLWYSWCVIGIYGLSMLRHILLRTVQNTTLPPQLASDQPATKKILPFLIREFLYLTTLIFILLIVNYTTLSLSLPTQRIVPKDSDKGYLLDFQSHTRYSDGSLSPEQRINWYVSQGIDGASITDHNTVESSLIAEKYVQKKGIPFLVIPGQEYTMLDPHIHLNILGLRQTLFPEGHIPPNTDTARSVSLYDLSPIVKKQKGLISLNHFNGKTDFNLSEINRMGLNSIEISNGNGSIRDDSLPYCFEQNFICLGGSDIHGNSEIKRFVRLRYNGPLTVPAVFEQLRLGKHEVIEIDYYPDRVKLPLLQLPIFRPAHSFLNYLINLDLIQLSSWGIWSMFFYIVIRRYLTWPALNSIRFIYNASNTRNE